MKKSLKTIGIIVICLILIWGIYITIDCIRLRNAKTGTKPLITIGEEKNESKITYKGLGYTIQYYVDIWEFTEFDGITNIEQFGYGAEFRVFNILIWAWVE